MLYREAQERVYAREPPHQDETVCLLEYGDAVWIGTTDEPTKDMTKEQKLAVEQCGQTVVARSRVTGSRMLATASLVLKDGTVHGPPE